MSQATCNQSTNCSYWSTWWLIWLLGTTTYRTTCLRCRIFLEAKFYCLHALADSNWYTQIRDKTLEFSAVQPALYPYLVLASAHSTHTQPFNGPLSGTTQVGRYQKKHSPTHTQPGHQTSFINFLRLQSVASSSFNLRAWQSFSITFLHVLFDLLLGLKPCTSYSVHFFTQSLSSFCNTCPYHSHLFCCSTEIMSSISNLSLSSHSKKKQITV